MNTEQPKSLVALLSEDFDLIKQVILNEGEISEDLEKAIIENSEALSGKIDSYSFVLHELDFRAEFLRKEARDLTEGARILENKAEALRDRLKYILTTAGKPLQGNKKYFKLGAPSVSIDLKESVNIGDLPGELVRTKIELNKTAVKDMWDQLSISTRDCFVKNQNQRLIEGVVTGKNK